MWITRAALALLVIAPLTGGCAAAEPEPLPAAAASPALSRAAAPTRQVIAISVDGLNPRAITRLGRSGAPTLHRLLREGAGTLNARTEYERTETLPNHTGMVTGLRIRAQQGGHGVEWNDDRPSPATVQQAAGRAVPSVFTQVRAAGGSSAVFASKTKFRLWQRSWPRAFSRFVVDLDNTSLLRTVRADLAQPRTFRFVHLSAPDVVGHREGYMGRAYLAQVRRTDAQLGRLIRAVRTRQPGAVVVLTSDHGGRGKRHDDATRLVNQRVPFVVWGPGVAHRDLYALNPAYANPGTRRVPYSAARQPVRNGAVANLSLDLLGLDALQGSEHDKRQDLQVTR